MLYAGLPGSAVDSLIKRDFAPAADRLRAVIARERAIPAIHAAARANLKNPPKEFTDLAIRMTKGSVGGFQGSVAAWTKSAAIRDETLLKEFEEVNAKVTVSTQNFAATETRTPDARSMSGPISSVTDRELLQKNPALILTISARMVVLKKRRRCNAASLFYGYSWT